MHLNMLPTADEVRPFEFQSYKVKIPALERLGVTTYSFPLGQRLIINQCKHMNTSLDKVRVDGTYSPRVTSGFSHLLVLSGKSLKASFVKLRTLLRLGGLNLVQILRHNAFHLPISRII